MKDGLVHQMLDYRLAADVHDERDARTNLGDIGEVLLRPDSEICTAADAELFEPAQNMQVGRFIRGEIVRLEVAALFGKLLDDAGKLSGRNRGRGGLCPALPLLAVNQRTDRQRQDENEGSCPPAAQLSSISKDPIRRVCWFHLCAAPFPKQIVLHRT